MKKLSYDLFMIIFAMGVLLITITVGAVDSYRINDEQTQEISEYLSPEHLDAGYDHYDVTNSSGEDIFVPTKTYAELEAFRGNPPAGVGITPAHTPVNGTWGGAWVNDGACGTFSSCAQRQEQRTCQGASYGGICSGAYPFRYVNCASAGDCCGNAICDAFFGETCGSCVTDCLSSCLSCAAQLINTPCGSALIPAAAHSISSAISSCPGICSGGVSATCNNGSWTSISNSCSLPSCPAGSYYKGSCGAGNYEQWTCPNGFYWK